MGSATPAVAVRSFRPEDWPAVARIYREGIDTGVATFEASVRLHEQAGFELVGRRERLGRLHGSWRDVLLFERRSPVVG